MDIEYGGTIGYREDTTSGLSFVVNRKINQKTSNKVLVNDKVPNEVIEELIDRYSFIYENSGIILGQLIKESKLLNLSIGDRLSNHTNIYLSDRNCPLDKETKIFYLLEEFLLGDISYDETSFYSLINLIKNDDSLFKYTKVQFVNEDVKDFNMRVVLEFVSYMIEQERGAYITSTKDLDSTNSYNFNNTISINDIKQKLKALKPYFDVVLYQNKENGMWDGKRRIWVDRRDSYDVKYTLVGKNSFNKYFCDYLYDVSDDLLENSFRLSEDIIQSIYLKYHDELAWNMKVKCESDSSLSRPLNTNSCGMDFNVLEEELFVHDDEVYQLCSNCGYIVRVLVSDSIKNRVKRKCMEDENKFRKKEILSELKGLERKKVLRKEI